MNEICKRVHEIRTYMSMSQVEFANRLGVTNAHISKIEKGKTVPSEALIKLICKEFGIIENWLKTGEGEMNKDIGEDITAMNLLNSSENINRLLKLGSLDIRLIMSRIEFLFSEILLLDNVSSELQLAYLSKIEPFIYELNKYITILKQSSIEKELNLDKSNLKQLNKKYSEKINAQLNELASFFVNN